MTSEDAKSQMDDILSKMKEYRGISAGEEVEYNGTSYRSGNIMKELRKDYTFWSKQYKSALRREGKSDEIVFKYARGYDI